MSSPSTQIFSKNRDFPWQTINGETIIIDPQGQTSFELNEVGSVVWNLTDGSTPVSQIQERLLESYEVSEQELTQDLNGILEELLTNKLIRPVHVAVAVAGAGDSPVIDA